MSDSSWDFEVGRTPALYDTGTAIVGFPGHDILYRKDTSRPLSVVSKKYALVTHQSVVQACRAYFNTLATDGFIVKESIQVTKNGARLWATWQFGQFDAIRQRLGDRNAHRIDKSSDIIIAGLRVINSLDESSRLGVEYGLYRVICSNMATIPIGNVAAASYKHVGELSVSTVAEYLKAGVESLGNVTNIIQTSALAGITLTDAIAIINDTALPELYRKLAVSNITTEASTVDERNEPQVTRWQLFNAITSVISQRARDNKIRLDRQREFELQAYEKVLEPLQTALR